MPLRRERHSFTRPTERLREPREHREVGVKPDALVLEDGTPADPQTFVSSEPNWREGDRVLIRPGFEFEIVAIDYRAEGAHATWTVRRR